MSYLSNLQKGIREEKEKQFKKVSEVKPSLFRNLNLTNQQVLLSKDTEQKLDKLSKERKELYKKLYEELKNSINIVDVKDVIKNVELPNNNKISFISLFENDLGENHYASVYLDLILEYEVKGDIIPGKTKLFETSSGSGGIACSKVAKDLGYSCLIALPAGGEKAREDTIKQNGAELELTDAQQYTNGFPMFVKRFLIRNKDAVNNKELFFLSHSQGKLREDGTFDNNEITIRALSKIGYNILQFFNNNGRHLDYFISGIGNGTNTLGIGGPLHLHGTKIIGFETFEGANMYDRIYPGKYEENFNIKPGELGRHSMPGLSPSNNKIYFPHFENSVDMIDSVYLVGNKQVKLKYQEQTGKQIPENIIYYDNDLYALSDWGRTTKAGFYVAMELTSKVKDKEILMLGYDKANRYDDYLVEKI
ncbi:MAG: pyridoxal-phosphate dependent enzyme [Candidatus Absconditicoccaceae bacterium]